jgi:Tfp pilus assembly protein PilF
MGFLFFGNAILGTIPAHDAMPQARKLVLRALDLDPDLPQGHAMLGAIATQYDYDWPEAERRFQRALSYTPVSADVHRIYGVSYLLGSGRPAEAVEEIHQAVLEDPLFHPARINYGMVLMAAGREQEAVEEFVKLVDLDPSLWPAHAMLSIAHERQGNLAQALSHAEKAYQLAPWNFGACGGFAGILARTGQHERAAELIAKVTPHDAYGAPMALAAYHLGRGELDQAADWFAKAIEQRDPRCIPFSYLLSPDFRSGPRWAKLAKMMNLPQTVTFSRH